jgi:hypothetical protein
MRLATAGFSSFTRTARAAFSETGFGLRDLNCCRIRSHALVCRIMVFCNSNCQQLRFYKSLLVHDATGRQRKFPRTRRRRRTQPNGRIVKVLETHSVVVPSVANQPDFGRARPRAFRDHDATGLEPNRVRRIIAHAEIRTRSFDLVSVQTRHIVGACSAVLHHIELALTQQETRRIVNEHVAPRKLDVTRHPSLVESRRAAFGSASDAPRLLYRHEFDLVAAHE